MRQTVRLLTCIFFLSVAFFVNRAPAQDTELALCSSCQQPNKSSYNFCTSCGARLTFTTLKNDRDRTVFRHPARLFSVPTAEVLPELHFAITLGNMFGMNVGESFLGTLGLGIGGIGELELSTADLIGNLATGTWAMRTSAFKLQIYTNPDLGINTGAALQSSNNWEEENRSEHIVILTAPDEYRRSLRGFNYESRIATLRLSIGFTIERTTFHGGFGYSDIRYRNVYSWFVDRPSISLPDETRRGQWQGSGGMAITLNERTKLMAELQTVPFLSYDVGTNRVRLTRMIVGALGARASLSENWSVDSGVRYQSNFIGLADVQIGIALNGVWSFK